MRILLITSVIILVTFFGCKKDEIELGSVEATVSYRPTFSSSARPDAGAMVYYYNETFLTKTYTFDGYFNLIDPDTKASISYKIKGESNVNGYVKLENVPLGSHIIVVVRNGYSNFGEKYKFYPINIKSRSQSITINF